jgi:tetratricopeptide (TPR) repeat protein
MRTRFARAAPAGLLAALLVPAVPAPAQEQARVQGVVNGAAGAPLEGVKVTITTPSNARLKLEVTTNRDGKWGTILGTAVPPYTYRFEKAGYVSSQVTRKVGVGSVENFSTVLYTPEQAISAGKAEVRKDPFVETYNEAVEKFEAKDYRAALAKAEEATKLGPDKPNAWALAAKMAAAAKEWNVAVADAERALALDPEATELYGLLAQGYRETGDTAKAAAYAKKFAEANPDNPDILYNQAVELYNKGDFKGAEPLLRKVLEARPDSPKAHFLLGMTCVNLNKIPEMKTHLSEYLRLDPKGADAAVAKEMLDAFK